jgi:hypothetical protein
MVLGALAHPQGIAKGIMNNGAIKFSMPARDLVS